MVLILFKMENFNKGGAIRRSKIIYPQKNRAKGSYEDCEDQLKCNSGKNPRLDKIFSKVMRKLDRRYEIIVPTNVKNIQHKKKDGERQNLNYFFRYKGIKCLNCKDFGHIQVECSSVSRKQRRSPMSLND